MRIDTYLFEFGIAKSRTAAQAMITDGRVFFDGKAVKKSSFSLFILFSTIILPHARFLVKHTYLPIRETILTYVFLKKRTNQA